MGTRIESQKDARDRIYAKVHKVVSNIHCIMESGDRDSSRALEADFSRIYADVDEAVIGEGRTKREVQEDCVLNFQNWKEFRRPEELMAENYNGLTTLDEIITAANDPNNFDVNWGFCCEYQNVNEGEIFRLFGAKTLDEMTIPYLIRAFIEHNLNTPNGITKSNFRRYGVLGIQVYQLTNRGLAWTDTIVDGFYNEFEGSVSDGVWYKNPRFNENGEEGRYFQSTLTFEFEYTNMKKNARM